MRVAFRADSGARIGSGHLMRCLTLADELRGGGAEVVFVTREHPGHFISRLDAGGHAVRRLPGHGRGAIREDDYASWLGVSQEKDAGDTLGCLERAVDWMIVDHYALDATWERAVKGAAKRILVIDDLANRGHACDRLLDQGYHGAESERRYAGLVGPDCRTLLGPRYALLKREFAEVRAASRPRDGSVRRILVFMGGSDPGDQTSRVLEALGAPRLAGIAVDVVIGASHPNAAAIAAAVAGREGATLYRDLPSLAPLMAKADLAIGAGGSTTWERCCVGLPSLTAIVAENQRPAAEALADDGFHVLVAGGRTPSAGDWRSAIESLIEDPAALAALGRRAAQLTDGLGAKRVALTMRDQERARLRVRRATPADEELLLEWANDPTVRAKSFNPARIEPGDHARWFAKKLADRSCEFLIGETGDGLPVGQVRFDLDRDRNEALINISVERGLRGGGNGDALLSAALEHLRQVDPGLVPVAEVLEGNDASHRLFTRLGFTPVPGRHPGAGAYELRAPAGARGTANEESE